MEHANISLEERRLTLKVAYWPHLTQNQSLFSQTWILGFSSDDRSHYNVSLGFAVRGKSKFCFVSIGREGNQ